MDEKEGNDVSPEAPGSAPEALKKPLSWSRSVRTSCDACKKMKIKCRRENDESCARCSGRNLECTTTPVERKKQKLTNTKDAYFDDMEERIKRMESAITTSRYQAEPLPDMKTEVDSSFDKIESQVELSDHLANLVIDPNDCPTFIGWSSGFSLLSPQGIRWISEKVDDQSDVAQLVLRMSKREHGVWGSGHADLWHPVPRSQHAPLPPKDLAMRYVNSFFAIFNNVYPFVNETVFRSFVEGQYSPYPPIDTAWYALFNAVLCIGSFGMRGSHEGASWDARLVDYTSSTQEAGVQYFRNASSCFHDLFFQEPSLMAMQVMVLLMYITTSSPNPQIAFIVSSAAGNLSSTLGLHRRLSGFNLSPDAMRERRDVFWVFYILEKTISHNLGRPSVINDDEIAIDLPTSIPSLSQSATGPQAYHMFRSQTTLAIIGSRICSELYSASSQTKSEADRLRILGKLDNELQRWRDSIPIDIRPEHPINCSDEQYVAVSMMHFAYLDAVILLHRLSGHQKSVRYDEIKGSKNYDEESRLNPRVYASQLLCLAAARRSIQLLDTLSNSNVQHQPLMWLALYYPLSASLILFTNILSNPRDQNAASDIQLMNIITNFIGRSVRPDSTFANTPTVGIFKGLYLIASHLVETRSGSHNQRIKRSRGVENRDLGKGTGFSELQSSRNPPVPTTNSASSTAPLQSDSTTPYSLQQPSGDKNQYMQTTATVNYTTTSQTSSTDSPLDFAPFIAPDPNEFDFNANMDDFLLTTNLDWDMSDMWNFVPDPWESGDFMRLEEGDDI